MEPVEFRRRLHAHPELSFKEHDTAAFIEQQLDELGIEHRRIASTGVVARIKGRKTPEGDRRAAVLRADIDALPVTERNDCEWRSQNEGVMHACGHDMHAAVLFGVLKTFAEAPDFRGTLFGLFQPGEECNPGGASLAAGRKAVRGLRRAGRRRRTRRTAAGSRDPREFRAGKYMAASDELRFRVRGTGGHGAMRKQLKDPVAAAAELADAPRRAQPRGVRALDRPRGGRGRHEHRARSRSIIEGTLRTFDERERGIIHRRIRRSSPRTSTPATACGPTSTIGRGYPCVVNDADRSSSRPRPWLRKPRSCGSRCCPCAPRPRISGFYCTQYPSLFYRLGVGAAAGRPAHGDIQPRRSGHRRGHRLHAETGPATPGKITPGSAKRTQAGRDSGKTGTTEIRRDRSPANF